MLYYCTSLFHDSISPLDSNACKCFRNKTHLNCRSGCISQRAPCMIWAFEEHRSGWYISPLIAFRVQTNTNVVTLTVARPRHPRGRPPNPFPTGSPLSHGSHRPSPRTRDHGNSSVYNLTVPCDMGSVPDSFRAFAIIVLKLVHHEILY